MAETDKKEKAGKKTADPNKNLHAGHRQRMKETFYKTGFKNMQPHQILEMVLFNTIPYVDTNGIAHQLIDRFGSLSGVFDADPDELLEIPAVKPATVFLLKMIPELAREYYADRSGKVGRVSSADDLARLFQPDFVGRSREVVALILLSSAGKVVYHDVLHEGSVNSVPVYKRRIMELCLKYNATAAVLAHNHPSGSVMPSSNDMRTTRSLSAALAAVDVTFQDHFIFTDDDYMSMRSSGWMEIAETDDSERRK